MSPTFQKALDALTNQINLSTGLAHPSDFRRAIEMFQWLIDAGEDAEQDAIITYLIDKRISEEVASEIQRTYEVLRAARTTRGSKWWPD